MDHIRRIIIFISRNREWQRLPRMRIVSKNQFFSFSSLTSFAAIPVINVKDEKLKPPDPSLLTSSYLIKNASLMAVDSATILLNQTACALIDATRNYGEALELLLSLLEMNLHIAENTTAESHLWDDIIECRGKASHYKHQIKDLELVFQSALRCLESASEAAFASGAEFSSLHASQLISSAKREIEQATETVSLLTQQLANMEVKNIEKSKNDSNNTDKDT